MSLCAEADKIWALRYIRESKAELTLARQIGKTEITRDIAVGAIKKAQPAVQHTLGQSDYPDLIVAEAALGKPEHVESPLRILLKMREVTTMLSEMKTPSGREATIKTAGTIVKAAESIVLAMTAG